MYQNKNQNIDEIIPQNIRNDLLTKYQNQCPFIYLLANENSSSTYSFVTTCINMNV